MGRFDVIIAAAALTAAGLWTAHAASARIDNAAQADASAPVFLRGVRKAIAAPEQAAGASVPAAHKPAKNAGKPPVSKTQPAPVRRAKPVRGPMQPPARQTVQRPALPPAPEPQEANLPPAYSHQSIGTQTDGNAAYLHISGLTLNGSVPGEQALETVLNFTGAVDPKLAEGLNKSLPDWIEFASSGYDTLLIRTKRKAVFSVQDKAGGVTIRIAWAPLGPEEPRVRLVRLRYLNEVGETRKARAILGELRGTELDPAELLKAEGDILARERDPRAAQKAFDAAIALRPSNEGYAEARENLRKRYADQAGATVSHQSVEGGDRQWRAQVSARAAISDQETLLAVVESVDLETDSVLNPDCTVTPFSGIRSRFDVRYQFDYGGGEIIEGAVFAAESVAGVGLSYRWLWPDETLELRAAWQEPTFDLVESIVHKGARDSLSVSYEGEHGKRWFFNAGLRLNHYSVEAESSVATTVSVQAGIRYREQIDRSFALTFAYAVDADYVQALTILDHDPTMDLALLPIVDREVHSVSAGVLAEFERQWTLDAEAGYAIDRFAEGGVFGRARLAYLLMPTLEIAADASYTAVSSRGNAAALGSSNGGATTAAALSLLYTFDGPGSLLAAWGDL